MWPKTGYASVFTEDGSGSHGGGDGGNSAPYSDTSEYCRKVWIVIILRTLTLHDRHGFSNQLIGLTANLQMTCCNLTNWRWNSSNAVWEARLRYGIGRALNSGAMFIQHARNLWADLRFSRAVAESGYACLIANMYITDNVTLCGTPCRMWDEISYPFLNFNGCTVEVLEWICNFIPWFIKDVITYHCWD